MSLITSATRAWLTRSMRPFRFNSKYDKTLVYEHAENLGLYVHVPFCRTICSFCPYCKELYDQKRANRYVDYLIKEIDQVCSGKAPKQVSSLYFGGGTPALIIDRLPEILRSLHQYFIITEGIGLELHPSDVTEDNLLKLKKFGVTKISIGIQSFQDKFLKVLGRAKFDYDSMFQTLNKVKIETVSMDFIFALPGQVFSNLKADIDMAFQRGANHIAIYPFIDFSFTDSAIPPMKKREKKQLLDQITDYCEEKGFRRDSIWTFASDKKAKYSSMTRDNFLGFGCSATTLLKEQFKINTFSVDAYEKRLDEDQLPTALTIRFTRRQRMIYYLFWTAYSTEIDSRRFADFFGEPLEKLYGFEFQMAKMLGFIEADNSTYRLTKKGAFYYHYYENYYTLSYIDKMWGVMRQEAFPERMEF